MKAAGKRQSNYTIACICGTLLANDCTHMRLNHKKLGFLREKNLNCSVRVHKFTENIHSLKYSVSNQTTVQTNQQLFSLTKVCTRMHKFKLNFFRFLLETSFVAFVTAAYALTAHTYALENFNLHSSILLGSSVNKVSALPLVFIVG